MSNRMVFFIVGEMVRYGIGVFIYDFFLSICMFLLFEDI